MSKIITFAAWKGGVGKTTLTYNLTAIAKENKILLIDIDPQCNLTKRYLKIWDNSIINNPLPIKTNYSHIDIICGDEQIINNWNKFNPQEIISKNQINYDYIVFDTPTSFNEKVVDVYNLSTEIYLITDSSIMSLEGLVKIINQFSAHRESKNKENNIKGVILNNLNRYKSTNNLIASLAKNNPTKGLLMTPYIYKKVSIANTLLFQKPITSMKDKQASQLLSELSKKIFK